MIILFVIAVLVLLLLAVALLILRRLFAQDAFRPPAGPQGVQVREWQRIPYLVEHDLPYPAGIQNSDRPLVSLDGEWQFYLEGEPNTETAVVPSCFNTANSLRRDFQGAVVYERQFSLPPWEEGSLVRLAFLGSFYKTEVWIDGQPAGSHEGGYLPFYFDISSLVEPGKIHSIRVRVDNRLDGDSLPPRLFQGHNLGWHPYGGLHRSVLVEICPPQYVFKLRVEGGAARVYISALLHRPHIAAAPFPSAALRLYDREGRLLAEAEAPLRWADGGRMAALRHTFDLPAPRPWQPTDPYLYRLEVQTAYERCATDFGLRTVQARAGKLLLNEQPLLLQGVCRHQEDRPDGLAQAPGAVERELASIRSLGGNFTRLAHYPHSSETLELCDRLGLCAWVEIPLYQAGLGIIRHVFDKTRRNTGKRLQALPGLLRGTAGLENPALLGKASAELLKMIERDANHPSILFWGLGNECWTLHPSGENALAWLRKQAEGFDTSRLFSYAAFSMPVLTPRFERSFQVVDAIAVNEYFGWYYGKAPQAGPFLQAVARKHPDKPLLVTETGADAVRGRHSAGGPQAQRYSEEYQAWLLEEHWRQMRRAPTFAGLSIWVFKDFLCPEYREDNPVPFYNLKGLVDRDGHPKAAFERIRKLFGGG